MFLIQLEDEVKEIGGKMGTESVDKSIILSGCSQIGYRVLKIVKGRECFLDSDWEYDADNYEEQENAIITGKIGFLFN